MNSTELLVALGLCEHCGTLVSLTDYPGDDSMNATWRCRCGEVLTHASFGYDKGTEGAKRVRWVGPDGKWTDTEPKKDFRLGKVNVIMKMPSCVY